MAHYIKLTLDWDGTLTKQDTMFMMGNIVAQRDRRLGLTRTPATTWDGFGASYMKDYAAHEKSYVPVKSERLSPESEAVWLQSLRGVENRSAHRVEQSGFFKDVNQEDVTNAAREAIQSGHVSLRSGWQKLITGTIATRAGEKTRNSIHVLDIGILSVNWSETFIRESLRISTDSIPHLDDHQRDTVKQFVATMPIQANEIVGLQDPKGSEGVLTRHHRLAVRTSLDKLQYLNRVPDQIHVYVGDSSTDLDCLLAADVGICIRDEPLTSSQQGLADILQRVSVSTRHVSDHGHVVDRHDGVTAKAKMWWARDFDEITSFLSRIPVRTN